MLRGHHRPPMWHTPHTVSGLSHKIYIPGKWFLTVTEYLLANANADSQNLSNDLSADFCLCWPVTTNKNHRNLAQSVSLGNKSVFLNLDLWGFPGTRDFMGQAAGQPPKLSKWSSSFHCLWVAVAADEQCRKSSSAITVFPAFNWQSKCRNRTMLSQVSKNECNSNFKSDFNT